VTVTDRAGNPVSGVTFPGNTGVCIGWGSRGATLDAGALDAADVGAQDGGANRDALDAGEAEGDAEGGRAPDARSADGAVDGAPDGSGAYDVAAPDAAEAGELACSTWRFWISAPASGVEVTAPGYERGTTANVPMVSGCCYAAYGSAPVFDRSVVLQPLPACPANWGPCSRDALRGSPTSCICP
jgi:hypothetical protein